MGVLKNAYKFWEKLKSENPARFYERLSIIINIINYVKNKIFINHNI